MKMKQIFLILLFFLVTAPSVIAQTIFKNQPTEGWYLMPGLSTTNYIRFDAGDRSAFDPSVFVSFGYNDLFEFDRPLGFDLRAFYELIWLNPDHYEFEDTGNSNYFMGVNTSFYYDLKWAHLRGGVPIYMNSYIGAPSVDFVLSSDIFIWEGIVLNMEVGRHLTHRTDPNKPHRGLIPEPMVDPASFYFSFAICYRFAFSKVSPGPSNTL
jgi:hypothetical protein